MTVYAVSKGCYSDYRVVAVYSTKQRAQEYIDYQKKYNRYTEVNDEIDEFELDGVKTENEKCQFRISEGKIVNYTIGEFNGQQDCKRSYPKGEVEYFIYVNFNPNLDVMKKAAIDKYYAMIAREQGI